MAFLGASDASRPLLPYQVEGGIAEKALHRFPIIGTVEFVDGLVMTGDKRVVLFGERSLSLVACLR